MNLGLRTITDLQEAEALLPKLERAVIESSLAWRETPVTAGAAKRLVERGFEQPSSCMVVAESEAEVLAIAASSPFTDPLTTEVVPMLVVLWVDPSIRNRGVARAIVDELHRRLTARGFQSMAARVGHTDDALTSMGERWGWVRSWSLLSTE